MTLESGLLVSPDALALVRFGLRAADDPRIVNTVKAIDSLLKRDLPAGPYWYRYNEDGYGEKEDGSPFDGAGIGRLWPLLTGERAHFEIAAGRKDEAARLLATLEASASDGGLLPEQIWDEADIADKELFLGRPSGSAMIGEEIAATPVALENAEFTEQHEMPHFMGNGVEIQREAGCRGLRLFFSQFQEAEAGLCVFPVRDARDDL